MVTTTMPLGLAEQYATAVGLPAVPNPDQAYADMTRREYQDYVANYRDFELDLIEKGMTDTSLIDQAREDAPKQPANPGNTTT